MLVSLIGLILWNATHNRGVADMALISWLWSLGFSDWMAVAGIIIGIVSLIYAVRVARRESEVKQLNEELKGLNEELKRQLKSISIDDIKIFSEDARKFFKDWRPEAIYCPDVRGAIVGYFLSRELGLSVPILSGYIFPRDNPIRDCNLDNHHTVLKTPKYEILLDKYVYKLVGKKILILDEIAVTGEAIYAIKEDLLLNGINNALVRSCVVVTCRAAITHGRKPDYIWREVQHEDIMFPWGRWS
jgi:hypoxanthine phosphoribosyltransferase